MTLTSGSTVHVMCVFLGRCVFSASSGANFDAHGHRYGDDINKCILIALSFLIEHERNQSVRHPGRPRGSDMDMGEWEKVHKKKKKMLHWICVIIQIIYY